MRLLRTPAGVDIEYLVTGAGDPVTVFAHGLGSSIPETRPLGSAVPGTKVFLHFRGHGGSATPAGRWTYADLAADLRAVADEMGAGQALGVSMGAAALTRLLADTPHRFDRLVFFLPAVIDRLRGAQTLTRLAALADAVTSGDSAALEREVRRELPERIRDQPAAVDYVRQRAASLGADGVARALLATPGLVAVPDRATLRHVGAPALVIAAEGDPLHPVPVARELAEALPHADLHVYPEPAVLWTARADLRRRISTFLGG